MMSMYNNGRLSTTMLPGQCKAKTPCEYHQNFSTSKCSNNSND